MELIVKLKQHTPMIHFQWDQEGATLRASELKPKLDKFLKKKNIIELNSLFGVKGNLPYKLVITSNNKNSGIDGIGEIKKDKKGKEIYYDSEHKRPKRGPFPPFFGNTKDTKEKRFVLYDDVQLRFISFEPQVIKALKNFLSEFLFVTNFGTRQSKGFGSFYVDFSDPIYKKPEEFTKGPNSITRYYFALEVGNGDFYDRYKNLFYSIDLFYRTLRSGINIKDSNGKTTFYFKSLMFLYAKSKNWTWDKKAIKEKFVDQSKLNKQKDNHPESDVLHFFSEEKYLVRDLLGVASLQNYNSYGFSLQYDDKNEIQRFKSPILFKPLIEDENKFTVYIILNPLNPGIFGKRFKMIKKRKDEIEVQDNIELETPPTGNFDLVEFFEFALSKISEIGIDKYVEKGFQQGDEYNKIRNIYTQLTAQYKNNKKKVEENHGKE